MVGETSYQELVAENKVLTERLIISDSKIAALEFELDNIKRAVFGSSIERQVGNEPDSSRLSLFPQEAPAEQEAPVTEQITYERRKPARSKNLPDRLDIADHIKREKLVLEPKDVDTSDMKCIGETVNNNTCQNIGEHHTPPRYTGI